MLIQKVTNPIDIIKKALEVFKPDNGEAIEKRREHAIVELERMAGVCDIGLDAVKFHADELQGTVTDERMKEIMTDILGHKTQLTKDHEVWQLLVAHVGQSYFLNFELEVKHIPAKCNTTMEAMVKAMQMHQEYYEIMGGIMRVIKKTLEDTR